MSFRLLSNRLFKHGRLFLRAYYRREIYTNILEHGKTRTIPAVLQKAGEQTLQKSQIASRYSNGIFRFGQHARKLFIDNLLNRVTTSYSADLRTRATKKLFYGNSAPFFALIGVSLASGAGVLSKEDELEGVCYEIREAASRLQNTWNSEEISKTVDENFNLDNLDIGPPIAKGCAAVVYAAALKSDVVPVNLPKEERSNWINLDRSELNDNIRPEMLTPIQNISRFVHNFGGSVDNLHRYNQGTTVDRFFDENPRVELSSKTDTNVTPRSRTNSNVNIQNRSDLSSLSNIAEMKNDLTTSSVSICRYPLALKMMFNYDIQSNAMSILRAMYKETIPARRRMVNETTDEWEKLLLDQTLSLPPHPNVVLMFGYFCAEIRNFRGGRLLYPMAQPPRINPDGYGRNKSLYLLMKRYDASLREYLGENITIRTRILLFAQLLEAVAHLFRHGIAHRDLKSDNILIELNDENSPPVLVLSDFGCCIADKDHGLQIPYTSHDMDKGGNTALMAPEIINKTPGTFSFLNYSKSDLWACGAIAYEIFNKSNPFYPSGEKVNSNSPETTSLKNSNYKEIDLPELGSNCPKIVQKLIYNILNTNPNQRLSPDVAANVMQIFLWGPSSWLKSGGMPSSPEVLQWLLSLSTKVMCEGRLGISSNTNPIGYKMGRRTYTEYLLISSFLARARLRRIRGALSWIQSIV